MHRPHRLAQRQREGLCQGLGDPPALEPQRRLGDRLEQRVVVDPHLDAAADLVGVEVAGERDQRRAVEEGAAHPGREIGGARPERRNAEPRRARQAAADVGREAGGALMRGQHEIEPAPPHGLHERQHIAAGDAKAAADSSRFQGCDDQIGVVHGGFSLRGRNG